MKRRLLLAGAGACAALGSAAVRAQAGWPSKPITIINPFPAGGGTDAFARPLSAQLTKQLGRQVIIENRGGAGGTLGAGVAARLAPDGHSFFMGAVHHTIAPALYPRLDYDLQKDFQPIMMVARVPQVIVVNPTKVPVQNFKEFLAYVQANPGKLNFASAGNGTSHHLAGELFKVLTKTFITHIPYRGAGPALQDLLAGGVDLMFDGLGSSAAHIKGGRIRAIAVGSQKRVDAFPSVPTVIESGVKDYVVHTWYGLWGIKGTPDPILNRMHKELTDALQSSAVKQSWDAQGAEADIAPPAKFEAFIRDETARWAAVAKRANAKLD